jgi:NAD(P)-dependent dehydrogenase (short-subunit alcohol dehydrogenase family)
MQDVAGRVAVITGGASGIGRGIAEVCARAGMKIVLADVDETRVAETARSLEKNGAEVLPVRTDVSKQAEVDLLARRALDAFGGFTGVQQRGVARRRADLASTLHDWGWIVGVNRWAWCTACIATPILLAQGEVTS